MITMDKKIALELAELYARHSTVVNLIHALEEYATLAQDPRSMPATPGQAGQVPSHAA